MPDNPLTTPIPPLFEPPNWARLPIAECGEPLVPLTSGEGGVYVRPMYAEQGIPGAPQTVWVRQGVRDRLFIAAQALPSDIGLMVFDGHRPLAVQQYLWDAFYAELARTYPELSDEALRLRVLQFVAAPSADPLCPPPHRTGGAVDVYLIENETGELLPMGTDPDETAPESVTRYFEEHTRADVGENGHSFAFTNFRENRRLLFHAMTRAGFTNYLGEWWHYDFGNQRWANCSGAAHAVYGVAPENHP